MLSFLFFSNFAIKDVSALLSLVTEYLTIAYSSVSLITFALNFFDISNTPLLAWTSSNNDSLSVLLIFLSKSNFIVGYPLSMLLTLYILDAIVFP